MSPIKLFLLYCRILLAALLLNGKVLAGKKPCCGKHTPWRGGRGTPLLLLLSSSVAEESPAKAQAGAGCSARVKSSVAKAASTEDQGGREDEYFRGSHQAPQPELLTFFLLFFFFFEAALYSQMLSP